MTFYSTRRKARDKHTDDWLMTYADMITLLLCFFVLFLSTALIDKKKQIKIEPPVVTQPRIQNAKFALPFPDLPSQVNVLPEEPEEMEPPKEHAEFSEIIEEKPEPTLSPVANLAEGGGDRITMVEMDSSTFFDKGSSQLTSSGIKLLSDVAQDLRADKFKDYMITVEGHTDDTPINTPAFPSNWELSTARASAVIHYLLDQGFSAQKLRAAGYADSFPKAPNRDAQGNPIPDNQAQNRRVVIRLEKIEKTR